MDKEILVCFYCLNQIKKKEVLLKVRDEKGSMCLYHENCYLWFAMNKEKPLYLRDPDLVKALNDVAFEYLKAKKIFKPFHNLHEAYAIILEELDELWEVIKGKDPNRIKLAVQEAIQVGAMALGVVYEFR